MFAIKNTTAAAANHDKKEEVAWAEVCQNWGTQKSGDRSGQWASESWSHCPLLGSVAAAMECELGITDPQEQNPAKEPGRSPAWSPWLLDQGQMASSPVGNICRRGFEGLSWEGRLEFTHVLPQANAGHSEFTFKSHSRRHLIRTLIFINIHKNMLKGILKLLSCSFFFLFF